MKISSLLFFIDTGPSLGGIGGGGTGPGSKPFLFSRVSSNNKKIEYLVFGWRRNTLLSEVLRVLNVISLIKNQIFILENTQLIKYPNSHI